VLCVHNVTGRRQVFEASKKDGLTVRGKLVDLIDPQRTAQVDQHGRLSVPVEPYGVAWMRAD
jgi:hypothetical protein